MPNNVNLSYGSVATIYFYKIAVRKTGKESAYNRLVLLEAVVKATSPQNLV